MLFRTVTSELSMTKSKEKQRIFVVVLIGQSLTCENAFHFGDNARAARRWGCLGLTDSRQRAKDTTDYRQNEKKNYWLPTEKKIKGLPTWTAIIDICFQTEEIRRAFCIFSSLRSNQIKGNYRTSCHLLTFWPEERWIILQNNLRYSSPRNLPQPRSQGTLLRGG